MLSRSYGLLLPEDYYARIADDSDPLQTRRVVSLALRLGVPPTVLLGRKVVTTYCHDAANKQVRAETDEWTQTDVDMLFAYDSWERGLCPGGNHPLSETSRPEHEDAYRADPPIACHYCKAQAVVAKAAGEKDDTAGLFYSFTLDPERVELNRQPVPPLPPELAAS